LVISGNIPSQRSASSTASLFSVCDHRATRSMDA
jgi:hypothetical protein